MSDKSDKRYSISRAIGQVLEDGVPTSITEAEFHFEALRAREKSQLRALGAPGGKSFIVPLGAMGRNTRELTVAASDWVGSQPLETPGILDWSCVRQAGATFFSGLREDLIAWHTDNFPISTWLPEVGLVVPSNPTTIASRLTPKRIATSVIYSRQLFVQASIAIDDYVTKTIARALNAKLDAACLYGAGGIEPLGILKRRSSMIEFSQASSIIWLLASGTVLQRGRVWI